ncbi:MAG: hypothetical protein ISS77_06725 [Phycisphaerae bacterium]|nr:hypothetical protein [Bacteroidota bacterium]MBL7107283.1 hypothetical protein [Phycisphaerae bacterium]
MAEANKNKILEGKLSKKNERRQNVVDRRIDFDLKRGPGRRRSDVRKAAEEGQMSEEQLEFLLAIDEYKRKNSRPFPTWTEVFEVIYALGYRKVAEPQQMIDIKMDKQPCCTK